jgi:serine/threonine protein kinase
MTNVMNESRQDELMMQAFLENPKIPTFTKEQQLQWRKKKLSKLMLDPNTLHVTERVLGQGGFGKVVTAYLRNNEVAVKCIMANNHSGLCYGVETEMLLMSYLGNHPTILTFYGYTLVGSAVNVVLEIAPYGALSEILFNYVAIPATPIALCLAWLCDMADALNYIHSKKVKHRDIKAENFLVFHKFRIKLCDFGLAKEHQSQINHSTSTTGTLAFMAPEVLQRKGSSYASDIYSFALTAIQVLHRKHPHEKQSCTHQLEAAVESAKGLREADKLLNILLECVTEDPQSRPTATELHLRCMDILRFNGSDPRTMDNAGYKQVLDLDRVVDEALHERRSVEMPEYNSGVTSSAASASNMSQSFVSNSFIQQSTVISKSQQLSVTNITDLNGEQAVEVLIDFGCIASLHKKVAEKGEYMDGDVLTAIDIDFLKYLEDATSRGRIMKLEAVLKKVKQAVSDGISHDIMERISSKCMERKQKNKLGVDVRDPPTSSK